MIWKNLDKYISVYLKRKLMIKYFKLKYCKLFFGVVNFEYKFMKLKMWINITNIY